MRLYFLLLLPILMQAMIQQPSYTPEQARHIINETANYINLVNESGYLIFYPSLSEAYAYMNNATKFCNSSPNLAVSYALKAKQIALQEEERLNSYRLISLISTLTFTILMLAILYLYMKPVRKIRQQKHRKASKQNLG